MLTHHIPLWYAQTKEALGTIAVRRAHDYDAAQDWQPLAGKVAELEAWIRHLEHTPEPSAITPALWAQRQQLLILQGDAPFTEEYDVGGPEEWH